MLDEYFITHEILFRTRIVTRVMAMTEDEAWTLAEQKIGDPKSNITKDNTDVISITKSFTNYNVGNNTLTSDPIEIFCAE